MKTVLFLNPVEPQCGVHQYGRNLFSLLEPSLKYRFVLHHPTCLADLETFSKRSFPQAIIYNWSAPIGGWMADAPFGLVSKHIAVYHAGDLNFSRFEAVLFSDPTISREGNIFPIGRPVPNITVNSFPPENSVPRIGVNGFCGAGAQNVAEKVLEEFDQAVLRLHLPSATYGDNLGDQARQTARECVKICERNRRIKVEINHDFLEMESLVAWLQQNDLNCYIRKPEPQWGRGVSSVLDVALAAHRPIAINRFYGFRHLYESAPEICVENSSLKTIMANGTRPLDRFYEQFSAQSIRAEVEQCLEEIGVN